MSTSTETIYTFFSEENEGKGKLQKASQRKQKEKSTLAQFEWKITINVTNSNIINSNRYDMLAMPKNKV